MGQTVLSLIQVFQKMLETETNLKRSLERTIWFELYCLLKIDENFVKGQYGLNHIVFYDFFCHYLVLENCVNSEI